MKPKKYAIKYWDTFHFAPAPCNVGNERDFFGECLEEMLQKCECKSGLPTAEHPWIFVRADSKQEILDDKFEVVETFYGTKDKDELWKLYEWCSQACTGFEVVLDY